MFGIKIGQRNLLFNCLSKHFLLWLILQHNFHKGVHHLSYGLAKYCPGTTFGPLHFFRTLAFNISFIWFAMKPWIFTPLKLSIYWTYFPLSADNLGFTGFVVFCFFCSRKSLIALVASDGIVCVNSLLVFLMSCILRDSLMHNQKLKTNFIPPSLPMDIIYWTFLFQFAHIPYHQFRCVNAQKWMQWLIH